MNYTGEEMKRVTIFLTDKQHESLRLLAIEKHTSMSALSREAVWELIEDEEDIRELLKARAEDGEGSITLEELERLRAEGKDGYRVILKPSVKETLASLPGQDYWAVVGALRSLAEDPRPAGAKKLTILNEEL